MTMEIYTKPLTKTPAISAALAIALLAASSLTAAGPITFSFQNGIDGYTGNRDVMLRESNPDTNFGGSDEVSVDTSSLKQVLIAFDDIIGTSANQIVPNSTIVSANYTVGIDSAGDALQLYLMTTDWDEDSVTFNNLSGGVTIGSQTASTPFETTGSIDAKGSYSFDLTSAVQAWANGTTNYGFAVMPTGSDGVDWFSSENSTVSARPKLTVEVAAPNSVSEPGTFALFAAAGLVSMAASWRRQPKQ